MECKGQHYIFAFQISLRIYFLKTQKKSDDRTPDFSCNQIKANKLAKFLL